MLSESILRALNTQYTHERQSAVLYTAMGADFGDSGLPGFEHWFRCQACEEMEHAERLYVYMRVRGHKPIVDALARPVAKWPSAAEAIMAAYEHEVMIWESIKSIVSEARKEADYATEDCLLWFIREQVEETARFRGLHHRIVKATDLLFLDKEMAKRCHKHRHDYDYDNPRRKYR